MVVRTSPRAEPQRPERARLAWRAHLPLLCVLAAGALLRLGFLIAFPGAFVSSEDSFAYLGMAWSHHLGIVHDRPSGYSMFLRVLSLPGHSITWLAVAQHVGGLLVAVLAYALLLRLGSRRWVATVVAGVLVLDAYAATLEHWLLTEAATTLTLTLAAFVTVWWRRNAWALAAGGALIGVAITMRTAAVFFVPVWLVYVLWARRWWPAVVAGVLCLALVPAGYMTWHDHKAGTFALTDMSGWFLYGRVARIGNCAGVDVPAQARPMCPYLIHPPQTATQAIWGGLESPAFRVFGGPTTEGLGADPILRRYALAVIRARPVTYSRMVGRDLVRYFQTGVDVTMGTVHLPTLPGPIPPTHLSIRDRLLPGFVPRRLFPAGAVTAYGSVVHVPRPVVGVLVVVAGILLVVTILGARWFALPRRREAFLLLGGGVLLVAGATATADYSFRYMIPAMPLLVAGIALVLEDAAAWRASRRRPVA